MADTAQIEPRKRRKRRHPWAFPLGFAIILFAAVGVVTLVTLGVDAIKNITDKSALKAQYEVFLTQVVRNDPQYFDNIQDADKAELMDSAIWYFLKDGGLSKKSYAYSESEPIGYIVPVSDIDGFYTKLFGSEYDRVYPTVEGQGYTFTFDPIKKSYIIPLTGADPLYIPKVYVIKKQGDSVILTVGYLAATAWGLDKDGQYAAPIPDKYVKITLRQTDNPEGYYVEAIQASEPPDNADPEKKIAATTEQATAEPSTAASTEAAETALESETGETAPAGETAETTVVL